MPPLKILGQHGGARPPLQDPPPPAVSRRSFLQLLGASITAAGLEGCFRPPAGHLVPYVRPRGGLTPGVPLHYATATALGGFATGLVVTAHEGRPTKIEGNPEHPASLGATRLFEQAALFSLYDPQRAQEFREAGATRSWWSFQASAVEREKLAASKHGAGLWFLLEPSASPTLGWLRRKIQAALPEARFSSYCAMAADNAYRGAGFAFGRPLEVRADLSKAAAIVALDSDILFDTIREARQFADRRLPGLRMNRLYVVESRLSVTGMCADHRERMPSSRIGEAALALLGEVVARLPADAVPAELRALRPPAPSALIRAAADDLVAHPAEALVLVGPRQPAEVHAAAQAIHLLLGSLGETVLCHEPIRHDVTAGPAALVELGAAIDAGLVDSLVLSAYDPVFTAPPDLELAARIVRVPWSAYLGSHLDETSKAATWFLPAAHEFECWRDERGPDGSATIAQPLLAPLFGGVSPLELLAAFLPERGLSGYEILRRHWLERRGEGGFDLFWQEAVQRGVVPDSAAPPVRPAPDWPRLAAALGRVRANPPTPDGTLELELFPSYTLHDGRYQDNAWLQELPDPVTKLTWGNAALISPSTAERLGLATFDVVKLTLNGRDVRAVTYVLPGTAEGCVALAVGHGRGEDRWGKPFGTNGYLLASAGRPWFAQGLRVERTGEQELLAVTQEEWMAEGRHVAPSVDLAELLSRAGRPMESRDPQPSLYAPYGYPGYRWAMAIDLSRCTGCSACVMACASENNTPVVGRWEVLRGREMHWLRIDRYFEGSLDDPAAVTQPVMCVHCEDAPCEYVCPVNATVHSDEGLNEMVYNRCVGTRYCSNNCPYKVRRFNFLDWGYQKPPLLKMLQNPEVTVRSRGVMEKCTYCVQRIERARIDSQLEGRSIRDGELQTACMQACPTRAIVFGTLSDGRSEVARLHGDDRAYHLLSELGTRPRTAHLARIKNPNPALRKS
ncbi:MAG: 4Fe-4S dicluster domain-containing protein [Myxococcales bacterium]